MSIGRKIVAISYAGLFLLAIHSFAIADEYPRIKQNGSVFIAPRFEINSRSDADGNSISDNDGDYNKYRMRFMFGWSYRVLVAVNEELDVYFRLSDPWGEGGYTIVGSGDGHSAPQEARVADLVRVTLPNAFFTWKPIGGLGFSGGLVNMANSSALEYEAAWVMRDPTANVANTWGNALAGFELAYAFNPDLQFSITGGLSDNTYHNIPPFAATDENKTLRSYSDARFIVAGEISLADKKLTLKPTFNIRTRGGQTDSTVDANDNPVRTINSDRSPFVSEGIDASVKFTSQLSLNANVTAAHDHRNDTEKYNIIGAGIEPVVTFGGKNGKLITARVKYAFDLASNSANDAVSTESAFGNHLDVRLSIAAAERFTITPRYRLWHTNGANWYDRAMSAYPDGDKRSRSLSRFELTFAAGF